MKAIKFRGKDLKGNWHYGDLVHLGEGYIIIEESKMGAPVKPEECEFALGYHEDEFSVIVPTTIGQFSGLYDKSGKEIYEGDIVRSDTKPFSTKNAKDNLYAVVEWLKSNAMFSLAFFFNPKGEKRGTWAGTRLLIGYFDRLEVIGNIYDNLKLLREGK